MVAFSRNESMLPQPTERSGVAGCGPGEQPLVASRGDTLGIPHWGTEGGQGVQKLAFALGTGHGALTGAAGVSVANFS